MHKYFEYNLTDNIDNLFLDNKFSIPRVINCLNPHSFVIALDDPLFKKALLNSDLLLPDGEGICLTLKKYKKIAIKKIAGDDLHNNILKQLSAKCGKVYYMGSTNEVLSRISARIAKEYPTLQIRTHSPSFGAELSEAESHQIINDINSFAPDVLFVSMTAPKQEKWVEKYRQYIVSTSVIASIGAVFDFYAGTVKRAPRWAIRLKLEWLFRLIKEPRRMWNRNFVSTPKFLRWVKQHHEEM